MGQVFGNPFINIKELFRFQGALGITDTTIVSDVFTVKNAEKVRFDAEANNVRFSLALRRVDSSGNQLFTSGDTPVAIADVNIFDATTVPVGYRKAFEHLYPDTGAIDDLHSFYKLVITLRADTAYVPPTPVPTGVPGLNNSSMIIKDENAPTLIIRANYINHKP